MPLLVLAAAVVLGLGVARVTKSTMLGLVAFALTLMGGASIAAGR